MQSQTNFRDEYIRPFLPKRNGRPHQLVD